MPQRQAMLTKFKQVLGIAATVGLLIAWFGLDAVRDYGWSRHVIKQERTKGWTLAATLNNYIDLTHPWTVVKQPVVRIWFVRPNALVHLSGNVAAVPVLTVDYEDMSRTVEDTSLEAFDCTDKKAAFISAGEIDPAKFQWRNYEAASTAQIAKIVCR